MNQTPMFKTCKVCGKNKSPDQFHKHNQTKDGLRYACIPCSKIRRHQGRTRRNFTRKTVKGTHDLHTRVDAQIMEGVRYIANARKATMSVVIEDALKKYVVEEMADAMRAVHRQSS